MNTTITTGRPDVDPSLPAHVKGVPQGNGVGNFERQPGHLPNEKSTAARSTGINPRRRNPIDPSMPNLSPA
jgi:hypothetical protein